MSGSKGYNGHKNWNHWNVSLWINNDEGLYRVAQELVRDSENKQVAAASLLAHLNDNGVHTTPDGAPYSVSSIRAAMVGM
ncbi:hypothetical protein AB870_03660 [Pandoraea faecigallinarum]|uniref:Uncharacterized protein n=1 Tax=Pandoraea faecigallinarum TaxID=656179 RepID=A0A0H3WS94_9BURK|nr:hypothetical protein [Pandoraea faecigallinarum]AKM29426.1 hypothetical protein AB870_03660 [Pandoraea faecigallinarum]